MLLLVRVADRRLRLHHEPRLGTVNAGLPGALRAGHPAVLELPRRLAEVPDVAVVVLRVPVESLLGRLSGEEEPVMDDGARDAEDLLRLCRDRDDVARPLAVLRPPVDESRPGPEREPRVVDLRAVEVAGIEARRPG